MTGSRKVGDCNWRNMNRKLDDNEIHEKVGDASPPLAVRCNVNGQLAPTDGAIRLVCCSFCRQRPSATLETLNYKEMLRNPSTAPLMQCLEKLLALLLKK